MSESRIDIIGQNGNDGEHYEETKKEVCWDDLAFLEGEDLGDVDPSTYQVQDDEGCEGGACKI